MSGSAQSASAPQQGAIPVFTPDQAKQAPPGTLFRTTDGRLRRVRGGDGDANIPVLTPEQARQAAPNTLFRTTDGRLRMARGASVAATDAPAAGAPAVSEGAIVRQNGRRYQMRAGQFVDIGEAPPSVAPQAVAPPAPPRQIDPNAQLPVWRGFGAAAPTPPAAPVAYEDPAPTGGLDSLRRFSGSGARDSDIQPRPGYVEPGSFKEIIGRKGFDPWTAASDMASDALASGVRTGLSAVFARTPETAQQDVPMPPSAMPPQPRQQAEQLPVWRGRGFPSIPSWSERARRRYPPRTPTPPEGDR